MEKQENRTVFNHCRDNRQDGQPSRSPAVSAKGWCYTHDPDKVGRKKSHGLFWSSIFVALVGYSLCNYDLKTMVKACNGGTLEALECLGDRVPQHMNIVP